MTCRGSSTTTQHKNAKICIKVSPCFVPDATTADSDFIFSYDITIYNDGEVPVRLLSRRWVITDGDNKQRQVSGDGVVGEQPTISPNNTYSYTSYVDLPTPIGCMSGAYVMSIPDGELFDAEINVFSFSAHLLN